MHAKWLVLAGVLMTSAAGCGYVIKATADSNGGNFSNYGTFFIVKGNSSGDPLTDTQLTSDVMGALMSKGWAEVPEGEGRAAVVIHTATTLEHTNETFYKGWGGWHWHWGGFNSPTKLIEDYKVGTVVVTIFDADTKQALWRGFAADAISDNPKQATRVREEAVVRIFNRFPASMQGATPAGMGTGMPAPEAAADSSNLTRIKAPDIIFSESPAVLILVDGDPIYRAVDGTGLQRLVNAKPLILRDEAGTLYLKILDGWMEGDSLEGWWSVTGVVPEDANAALRNAVATTSVDLLDGASAPVGERRASLADGRAPAIYVSTTQATLILTDGPPRFVSRGDSSLEYVENTTSKVFREPTDQELYVLISGRWFRSWRTGGPWQFVPSDQLPADFATIPESRLKSNVRGRTGG